MAKKQVYHERTRHIYVGFHFNREILNKGYIGLQTIHTKENTVDMLIKVAPGVKFAHGKELLHILKLHELGGARLDELQMA